MAGSVVTRVSCRENTFVAENDTGWRVVDCPTGQSTAAAGSGTGGASLASMSPSFSPQVPPAEPASTYEEYEARNLDSGDEDDSEDGGLFF